MNRLLATMMAGLMLILPSCTVGGSNVDQMSEQQFTQIVQSAESAVTIGMIVLRDDLKSGSRDAILTAVTQLSKAVEGGDVSLPNSVDGIMAQFSTELVKAGLDEKEVALIRACVRLADASLGGVQLGTGIDGIGSERTKTVFLAIMRGFEVGLK